MILKLHLKLHHFVGTLRCGVLNFSRMGELLRHQKVFNLKIHFFIRAINHLKASNTSNIIIYSFKYYIDVVFQLYFIKYFILSILRYLWLILDIFLDFFSNVFKFYFTQLNFKNKIKLFSYI